MNAAMLMVCLAGNAAVAQQPPETVFKAPLIEVKTEERDGKTYSFLMYNQVYLGRQYHKTKDKPDLDRLPTTYYHDKSPIGIVLKDSKRFPPKAEPPVAVLGMEIGTVASYAQPGQTLHFTERVPTLIKLSMPDKGEKRYFTFVQDALDRGVKLKVFEGEPRAMLQKHGSDKFYQVIVIETAKLPVSEVHKELLTKEAMQLLMSKLREDGIVAFHTSNRYYQLPPIIASAANELNLACIVGNDRGYYDDPKSDFRFSSEWVMVARDAKHLAHLKKDETNRIDWHPPVRTTIVRGKLVEEVIDKEFLWTDKGEKSFRGLSRSEQGTDTLFKAPKIEVKTGQDGDKTHTYLLYNRIYMGRQYQKTKEQPDLHLLPTTYFHDKGPIGVILKDSNRFPPKKEPPVAVLGMDVGTLAAYAKPGQTFHFTERVPTFVKLSLPDKGEKRYFTFIQDALDRGAKVKIFEGEPRDMIEKHGKDNFYQVIVVETYKLPVIDVHKELLTKEALQMLMSKLREDGLVAFHTSNRYYDLVPIIASAANGLKLACVVGKDSSRYREGDEDFRYSSEWVMVARDAKHLAHLKTDEKRNKVVWDAPRRTNIVRGKFSDNKIDREYLWTDKGEQSFRGLYRSDPEIDKLHNVLYDLEDVARSSLGVADTYRYSRWLHDGIRAWSALSAEGLNRGGPGSKDKKDAPKGKTTENK